MKDNYIVYFDESGDDGVTTSSSDTFILTGIYMSMNQWQDNYNKMKSLRKLLKERYGFHTTEEIHTKHLLADKDPYRKYCWEKSEKLELIKSFTKGLTDLDFRTINVVIDKTKFKDENYKVLENALKYNIQRIDNDSSGEWNYVIIADKGRIAPMRKTARAIRAYNPIPSRYPGQVYNKPNNNLIEDILEKDSAESYFIQISDFISYFVNLYYKAECLGKSLPNRVGRLVDIRFVKRVLITLREGECLNIKAGSGNEFGLVIYPK